MKETKNHKLIKEVVETTEMLYYYSNSAQKLLNELRSTTLTRTEEERWNTKERLIEDLESFTY
jgi:hypothetical protein